MESIVLGAGGMMPMPNRFTTSVVLRKDGRMILFDAGEGIQIPLKRSGLGIRALDIVAISHLHADHVLGLPGILMFRAQCDDPSPLTIVGPKGIRRFIDNTIRDLRYHLNYELIFVEWEHAQNTVATIWNDGTLHWMPLRHSTFCLGYRFEEAPRPGKFNIDKAQKLGIPPGPLYGQLQNGLSVTLDDGRTITPSDVLGATRRGRVFTYATDTMPCDGLKRLCSNADIAFVEGMFALEHQKEAEEKYHSTAAASAGIAREAGVQKLVLIHVSPRYTWDDEKQLADEARVHFPDASVARTLNRYDVPLSN